jgi:zeaxanthin glucosyltransferase
VIIDRPLRFAILVDDHIGHVHALAGVARRLTGRGHDVCFFGPGGLARHVEAAGFTYRTAGFLSPDIGSGDPAGRPASKAAWRVALDARTAGIRSGARDLIATWPPDLIIFDPFLLCHYPAFAEFGVRCVAVSTKPLLTGDPLVPPYTSHVVPPADRKWSWQVMAAQGRQYLDYAGYRSRCLWDESVHGRSHRSLTLAVARATDFPLRQQWTTRPLNWDLRYRSVPELVLHAREFEFPRRRPLCGPGAYLGPCVDLPRPDGSESPEGTGPLLVCNLGSVPAQQGQAARNGYLAIIDALRREPSWRAVIATGHRDLTQQFTAAARSLGPRLMLRDWVPRGSWLAGADVVITHGGANSVKEAILAKRPLLVLPRSADQPGIAARVSYHGIGLTATSLAPDALHQQMSHLLANPAFRISVAAMAGHFIRYDQQQICEHVLERAAEGYVPLFADPMLEDPAPERPVIEDVNS